MRVDFYIIEDAADMAPIKVATRLVEKAHHQQLRVLVMCPNENTAEALDDWLWTFDDASFIPHAIRAALPEGEDPPVQITTPNGPLEGKFDILINMTDDMIDKHTDFKRVLELVPADKKPEGRARYKAYREQKRELFKHTI